MSTTGDLIREKAQKILMLQSMVKAQLAQQNYEGVISALQEMTEIAEDVMTVSLEDNNFEGLVVYTNATSFILRTHNEVKAYSITLPYSLLIADEALTLILSLELNAPQSVNPFQMAHFKISYVAQVIKIYLYALDVEDNQVLEQPKFINHLIDLMGAFVAMYDNLKTIAPQSHVIEGLASMYSLSKKYADPDKIDDDTECVLDTCDKLYDLIIDTDINDG